MWFYINIPPILYLASGQAGAKPHCAHMRLGAEMLWFAVPGAVAEHCWPGAAMRTERTLGNGILGIGFGL
jgi:hypothetical protein